MTQEELRILAWTLLGEAGGEGEQGLKAVAHVIRNRAESGRFPSNPAAVAIQSNGRGTYQFSTWNAASNGGNSPRSKYPITSEEFRRAAAVVQTIFGPTPGNDPTRGATHYYSPGGMPGGAEPYWWTSEAKNGSVKIGGHIFAVKQPGPVVGIPTPATQRPGNDITPVKNQPVSFADVQTIRTGRSVGLPDLNAGAPFVYDPVQHKMVAKETPAAAIIAASGSAKAAQTKLAMSYAGQERAKPIQLGLTAGEMWTTVATISTKPQAANDDIDWSSIPVSGPVVASIPTSTSKGSSQKNVQEQRSEQQSQRVSSPSIDWTSVPVSAGTKVATIPTKPQVSGAVSYAGQERGMTPKVNKTTVNPIVAGFSTPGGIEGIKEVDKAREKAKPLPASTKAVPAAAGSTVKKTEEKLAPSPTGINPTVQGGARSRDSIDAAAAGRAVAAKMAGKTGPVVVAQPNKLPPLPQPRPAPPPPSAPVTKVIVQGGNYGGGSSNPSPVEYVTTQTGKTAVAGSTYRGTDGYEYRVESNGTITNTKSGSNSGTYYNTDTNRFEKR